MADQTPVKAEKERGGGMLRAAAVFGDHMVLQRGKPVNVFGEASGPVEVSLAGRSAAAYPENGRFLAVLPALDAGGPYSLTLRSGRETVTFTDVMVGEVWLCGGQSNMELALVNAAGGPEENAAASDPLLRFYTVPEAATAEEAAVNENGTSWITAAPGAVGCVSAVAYFAGQTLRAELGVPVGMAVCCLGGTQIACWMSRECLDGFEEGRAENAAFDIAVKGITEEMYQRAAEEYLAVRQKYWADTDALRRRCPGITAAGIERELGPYPWPPPFGPKMPRRPGGLWEGMVSRIVPLSVRGLLWYQGETDSGHAGMYPALFAHMIGFWRQAFGEIPVIACQLPGFGSDPDNEDWPGIRSAQEKVCDETPGCYLACLIDCGDREDLHPADKRTPGGRLAALALRHVYGVPVPADAPRLTGVRREGDRAVLRFSAPLAPLEGPPRGLCVGGAPCAEASVSGDELRLAAPEGARVAYAWENAPDISLFGADGLPVFPFETGV